VTNLEDLLCHRDFKYDGILSRYDGDQSDYLLRCERTWDLTRKTLSNPLSFNEWFRRLRELMTVYVGNPVTEGGFGGAGWSWSADLSWVVDIANDDWPTREEREKITEYSIGEMPKFSLKIFWYPPCNQAYAFVRRAWEHYTAALRGSGWRVCLFFRDLCVSHWFGKGNTGLPQLIVNAIFHPMQTGRHDLAAYRLTTDDFRQYWECKVLSNSSWFYIQPQDMWSLEKEKEND